VIAGERYSNVPDEVIRYVGGKFGKPTVAVEPNVLDKIMSLPRAQALLEEPTMPELSELRRKFEPGIDDEELVLRVVMPQDQVDAMKAAGPVRQSYNPGAKPILTLLEAVSRPTCRISPCRNPGFKSCSQGETDAVCLLTGRARMTRS